MKLSEANRKKIEKELDEKVKLQIEESDDPIDKTVNRKWITNVMVKLERIARPVVKEQNGYDITKIFK